ncbi:hypothetical protein [Chitinophaga filiformis]|uniref:Uncharacterized protein n=1 Tax=Chitinophaga filiformis TaxID=104663 RepID=A0A1G7TNU1_CHIFI|nr:hypothetical protein [Chitinophaga filiformis]SDG36996.1 hypothetical protein SAMN04488121_10427 [Chitinophaga filiformis]
MNLERKIGIVTGVLTIIGTIYALFVTNVITWKKDALETQEKKNTLNAAEPRLTVCYAEVSGDLNRAQGSSASKEPELANLASLRIADNGLLSCTEACLNIASKKKLKTHTIYLLIENKGKDPASGIKIEYTICGLSNIVKIKDSIVGTFDYETAILSAADNQSKYIQTVPFEIESGMKILVPVLIATVGPKAKDLSQEWQIVSRLVYLPRIMKYKSEISKKDYADSVRRMEAPMKASDLVNIRG